MKGLEVDWPNNLSSINEISTISYWYKWADYYSDFSRTSEFTYGHKIVKILKDSGFLKENMNIIEIAGGIGAFTIPLSLEVRSVTTLEPAKRMVQKLKTNINDSRINNIKLIMETCQTFLSREIRPDFDLSVICNATWQFPNTIWLITFMEKMSNGKVCLADSFPTDNNEKSNFYRELGIMHESINRFNLLRKTISSYNRQPNIRIFSFMMRRSVDSELAMLTQALSKYRQPDQEDLLRIENYVEKHSSSGIFEEEAKMGVLWWHNQNLPN